MKSQEEVTSNQVVKVQIGGTKTTDDILKGLIKNGFKKVNEWITQKTFPIKTDEKIKEIEIEIIDPGRSFNKEDALKFLIAAGLRRPTKESALRFAEQYYYGRADDAKKPYVIFLHVPWMDKNRAHCVLCVNRDPDNRELRLRYQVNGFDNRCVLAGIRPHK